MSREIPTTYNVNYEQATAIEAVIMANPGANVLDMADSINLPASKFHQFLNYHRRGRELASRNMVAASTRGCNPLWWTPNMPKIERNFQLLGPRQLGHAGTPDSQALSETAARELAKADHYGRKHLQAIERHQTETLAMIHSRDNIVESYKQIVRRLQGDKLALENRLRESDKVIQRNTDALARFNILLTGGDPLLRGFTKR